MVLNQRSADAQRGDEFFGDTLHARVFDRRLGCDCEGPRGAGDGRRRIEANLIKPELIIGGLRYLVFNMVTTATSAVAQHPAVAVAGKMGEYALTGVGASVDWQSYGSAGNLLWKLIRAPIPPEPKAASKDHS